jgi:hypothetical protein
MISLCARRSIRFISKNFIIGLVFQVTFFAVVAALMQYGFLKGGETLAAAFMIISLSLVLVCGYTAKLTNQQTYRHETESLTKTGALLKCFILVVFTMFSIWAGCSIYLSRIADSVEGPPEAVIVSRLKALTIRFPLESAPTLKASTEARQELLSATTLSSSHVETKELLDLPNQVVDSILNVRAVACSKLQEGTGFAISDSLVLTNAHTIAGAKNVRLVNSLGNTASGWVVGFDASRDLALINVAGMDLKPLRFARPEVGSATAFGYVKDKGLQAVSVSLVERLTANGYDLYQEVPTKRKVWYVTGPLTRGFSGGPVTNSAGDVVGVTFAVSRSAENTSIPTGYILDELEARAFISNTDTDRAADTLDCYR